MQKNIAHKTAPRNAMSYRRDKNPIKLQGCKQIGPEDCPDKMLTPHLQGQELDDTPLLNNLAYRHQIRDEAAI